LANRKAALHVVESFALAKLLCHLTSLDFDHVVGNLLNTASQRHNRLM
jgi:hypothetical protein